jgi:hypothetical protein
MLKWKRFAAPNVSVVRPSGPTLYVPELLIRNPSSRLPTLSCRRKYSRWWWGRCLIVSPSNSLAPPIPSDAASTSDDKEDDAPGADEEVGEIPNPAQCRLCWNMARCLLTSTASTSEGLNPLVRGVCGDSATDAACLGGSFIQFFNAHSEFLGKTWYVIDSSPTPLFSASVQFILSMPRIGIDCPHAFVICWQIILYIQDSRNTAED